MPQRKKQKARDVRRVRRMARLGPTLGFRVKDGRGRYRSNLIWVDPTYEGVVSTAVTGYHFFFSIGPFASGM
jgi:hypothetical protein